MNGQFEVEHSSYPVGALYAVDTDGVVKYCVYDMINVAKLSEEVLPREKAISIATEANKIHREARRNGTWTPHGIYPGAREFVQLAARKQ